MVPGMRIRLCSIIFFGLICGTLGAHDLNGRWAGVADTTDEAGVKRQEKQGFEIKVEDGKLTAASIGRNGNPGAPLQIQQDGDKFNLYRFLAFEGGEHLRWKVELKDGKLVGKFICEHDNPKKWIYDRTGAITFSKVDPAGTTPAK